MTVVDLDTHHNPTVEKRDDPRKALYPGLSQYRAVCSCGYKGRWRNYRSGAERDAGPCLP